MQTVDEDRVTGLQGQIQLLSDLKSRLQTLRQVPLVLLRNPMTGLGTSSLRNELEQVKVLGDRIRGEEVQSALSRAKESLESDRSDLNPDLRRENRKRRTESGESVDGYITIEEKENIVFPPCDDKLGADSIEGVTRYIIEFNKRQSPKKLQLWRATRGMADEDSKTVRLTIPDVLTAYVTLLIDPEKYGAVVVESVTVFGSRERKSPHLQSDYAVYRQVSEQVARMLESEPSVAVASVMDLLVAYENLFIERCVVCERVLATEGHIPPVVRRWTAGRWSARHAGCI